MEKFDFNLRKRRSWAREMMITLGYGFGLWMAVQGALNYSAYAQIVNYKIQSLQKWNQSLSVKPGHLEADLLAVPASEDPYSILPAQKASESDFIKVGNEILERKNQFKTAFANFEVNPSDDRIELPRIEKNVPLITVPNHKDWGRLEGIIQKGLQNGVVVHPISHNPGEKGNFFVTGHSSYYAWDSGEFKDVFALLHEVKIGDEVVVYWKGKKYIYEIKARQIVTPLQTDVLAQPEDRSIITLMTCTPVGTNKNRLILVGELQES